MQGAVGNIISVANFLLNSAVEEFFKLPNICQSHERMYGGMYFLTHAVEYICTYT